MIRLPGVRILAGLALSMAGAGGCATALINDTITRQGDGWTMMLERLSDGPNQVRPLGYTVYEPPEGQRFLHAFIKFQNDSQQPRVFGYDTCDLDLDGELVLPGMITRYNGVMSVIEKNETYPPGEQNARVLIFNYPVGRLPTRLKCAHVTFDVPKGTAIPPAGR